MRRTSCSQQLFTTYRAHLGHEQARIFRQSGGAPELVGGVDTPKVHAGTKPDALRCQQYQGSEQRALREREGREGG